MGSEMCIRDRLSRTRLDEFLREIAKIKGVTETSAHIVLEELSRHERE